MLPEVLGGALDGARAAVGEPLAWLAVLALTLVAGGRSPAPRLMTLALFGLAALVAGGMPPNPGHPGVAAGLLAALGMVAASGWQPGSLVQGTASVAAGVAFGLACGLPLALPTEAAGSIATGVLLLVLLLTSVRQGQRRWADRAAWRLAPRVAGAWIAAIGLLLMALQLWGRGR